MTPIIKGGSKMKIFRCDMCGCIDKHRPEEESEKELIDEFGPKYCDVVCDKCWEKLRLRTD